REYPHCGSQQKKESLARHHLRPGGAAGGARARPTRAWCTAVVRTMEVPMKRKAIAIALGALFAAGLTSAAHAQVNVGGRIVIPAEDFALGTDDEDSVSVKGGVGVRSAGGQAAQLLRGAVPVSSLP